MLKKYLIAAVILITALPLAAQKNKKIDNTKVIGTKYPITPSIEKFYTETEIDSFIKKSASETFQLNQIPTDEFEKRYSAVGNNFCKDYWKSILPELKEYYRLYNDKVKAKKGSSEYREAKDDLKFKIEFSVGKFITNSAKYSQLLNYQTDDQIYTLHSDITVNENGNISVIETIKIYNGNGKPNFKYKKDGNETYEGGTKDEIKKGIVRYIPEDYYAFAGLNYNAHLDIDSITRNGITEPYKEKSKEGSKVLLIGDPTGHLSDGIHTYKIYYTTKYQITEGNNYDELYWNVNGNGWTMPIDSVSCTLHLPKGAKALSNACYTGAFGSKEQNCISTTDSVNGIINFAAKTGLKEGEGLTIATSWPKGFIKHTAAWVKILTSNGVLIGLFICLFLLLRNLLYRSIYKLKNKTDNIIPEFSPPEGLNPALAGFIDKKGHYPEHTVASLTDLAVNKKLDIEVQNEANTVSYYIKKGINNDDKTTHHLFNLEGLMLTDTELLPQTPNAAMAYFDDVVENYCLQKFKNTPFYIHKKNAQIWGTIIAWSGVLLTGLFFATHYKPNFYTVLYAFIGLTLTLIVNRLLHVKRTVYTPHGRTVMKKINGFKMFLKTADEQRLDMMNRPGTNLTLEEYLPWAIALGCEIDWAKKFSKDSANSFAMQAVSVGVTTTTTAMLTSSVLRSRGMNFHDYVLEKLERLQREQNISKNNYDEVLKKLEIKRQDNHPEAKNIRDNLDMEDSNKSSKSNSTDSSDDKYTPPSKGGGYSGGGSGGGGGGGW